MKRPLLLGCAAAAALLAPDVSPALDQVKTTERMIAGTVTSVSALAVTVEQNGGPREIPANEVESISFDSEPNVLKTARSNATAGRYEDALEALADLDTATINRREVVQDVEFYRAYCAAQLALAGSGDLADAGSRMYKFADANRDSFHLFDAQLLVGDLGIAIGNVKLAMDQYTKVGQNAPWPDLKARAAVALGRAHLAQGQVEEAARNFKIVLDIQDPSEAVQRQKLAARLGEARCLAAGGKDAEATGMIEDVIKQADSEDTQLLAKAYNALGDAQRSAGNPKEALMAYLLVDLVYFSSPAEHIEALQNLVELWNEQHMPERSTEAARTLRERYKRSPR